MRNLEFESEIVVSSQVPRIYSQIIDKLDLPADTDMSRSVKCHTMTLSLLGALQNRNLPARRELHVDESGLWHYVIAHADKDAQPLAQDTITDLNPWQDEETGNHSGFLHAPRERVQEVMRRALVPENVIALRGVQSITTPHCEKFVPKIPKNSYPTQ